DSLSFVFPDERNRVRENAVKMLKGERSIPYEYQFVNKEGEVRWIMETVVPIQYLGRRAALGNFMDITERKQAEEALRKSEEHYRLLAENVTDVIWTMDNKMQFTYISPSVTRQRGYSVEEAMALGMERSLTPASLEVAAKVILEGLSAEMKGQKALSRTWTVELEMYCKDGSTIWTEMEATFLRDSDGQAVGVLGVARDITERKKAEEALQHSEQYFRALIENAQDAIVIMNSDATIRYESPSIERMTGRKVKARIGKNPFEFC
ncbi:unnamed protein product, partial [marine sediment metagenome]